jgi:hypothetical protein
VERQTQECQGEPKFSFWKRGYFPCDLCGPDGGEREGLRSCDSGLAGEGERGDGFAGDAEAAVGEGLGL